MDTVGKSWMWFFSASERVQEYEREIYFMDI